VEDVKEHQSQVATGTLALSEDGLNALVAVTRAGFTIEDGGSEWPLDVSERLISLEAAGASIGLSMGVVGLFLVEGLRKRIVPAIELSLPALLGLAGSAVYFKPNDQVADRVRLQCA